VVTFRDVPAEVALGDDLVVADDGTMTRTGRIIDPGLDDRHVVTVDWGDGSAPETVTVTSRTFELRHRYGTPVPLLGALSSDAPLLASFVVVITACDTSAPTACGTATFNVGGDVPPPPPTADLAVLVRPLGAALPGQRVLVSVTVTNSGPSEAADVVVVLTLPPGTSTAGVEADGWRCAASDARGIVTCSPLGPTLPVGAWALSLPVDVGVDSIGRLEFEASVRSSTADPAAANNRSTDGGDVAPRPFSPPSPVTPAPVTPPSTPTGELPATGTTGMALQLQLAALAALLGLVVRGTARRRTRG
jgi:uncharacterized repeat protein (TIGR01451 family)